MAERSGVYILCYLLCLNAIIITGNVRGKRSICVLHVRNYILQTATHTYYRLIMLSYIRPFI